MHECVVTDWHLAMPALKAPLRVWNQARQCLHDRVQNCLLNSRKFSSAKNFIKSDRQAVRQEFIFVKSRSSLVCSLLVKNISQEFNLVKKLL